MLVKGVPFIVVEFKIQNLQTIDNQIKKMSLFTNFKNIF